jgi:hypothetical protein
MKSGWPVLLGIGGLVSAAFWFDAHSNQVADAASGWMTPATDPAPPAAQPPPPATPPTDVTAKPTTDSTVAFGSSNESK